MLELTNVRKTFNKGTINEKKALNGINLSLKDGDLVTVIGGNGAGKSTMLNMIAGGDKIPACFTVFAEKQGQLRQNLRNFSHFAALICDILYAV